MSQLVRLVSINQDAEEIIAYCARVSNPANQENHQTVDKLLGYCIKHGHWSIFEMANMILEINTTRSISPQILRHRSFSFQEFSQRYARVSDLGGIDLPHLRRQDTKNRQNSFDDLSQEQTQLFYRTESNNSSDLSTALTPELRRELTEMRHLLQTIAEKL